MDPFIRKYWYGIIPLFAALLVPAPVEAAFLVEAHDSGLAFENFELGGDTSTTSDSIPSTAVGTTSTNSIFGGDGVDLPTPTFFTSHLTGDDDDNLTFAAGAVASR